MMSGVTVCLDMRETSVKQTTMIVTPISVNTEPLAWLDTKITNTILFSISIIIV